VASPSLFDFYPRFSNLNVITAPVHLIMFLFSTCFPENKLKTEVVKGKTAAVLGSQTVLLKLYSLLGKVSAHQPLVKWTAFSAQFLKYKPKTQEKWKRRLLLFGGIWSSGSSWLVAVKEFVQLVLGFVLQFLLGLQPFLLQFLPGLCLRLLLPLV